MFTALVHGTHSALVGCRLFVPEEWTADKPRCLKAGMPEEQIKPRSKIEHFSDLIDQAVEQGLRFKLVGCDSFYGRDQGLLGRIADKGLIFVADIPRDTQVWTKKPQGEQRPRAVGASGATRVDQLKTLPMSRVKVRDAENGPVVVRAWQTIRCANGAAGTTTWRWWDWRCSSCWRSVMSGGGRCPGSPPPTSPSCCTGSLPRSRRARP